MRKFVVSLVLAIVILGGVLAFVLLWTFDRRFGLGLQRAAERLVPPLVGLFRGSR